MWLHLGGEEGPLLLADVYGVALHVGLDIHARVEAIDVEETVARCGLSRGQACEGPEDAVREDSYTRGKHSEGSGALSR